MEMGTHWLRLADRNWRSCKISHAVKRKGHFVRSSGFAAQNPVRVANHSKADVFLMVVCHMKSRWHHSETTMFGKSWAGARSAGMFLSITSAPLLAKDTTNFGSDGKNPGSEESTKIDEETMLCIIY